MSGYQFKRIYRKAGFVCKGRATMPWLDLIPEDDFYLAFVFTTGGDERLHDCVYDYRKLATDYEMKEISRGEWLER